MENYPFLYGRTVKGKHFINRIDEINTLVNYWKSNINTIIISPRRWGKSSLIKKASEKLIAYDKKILLCYIDLFTIRTEEEFLEAYTREVIKCTASKAEEWIKTGKEFFKKIIPNFSFSIDPQSDFSISFDWKDLEQHKDEILNLPEKMAIKKGIRIIMCLDEFQNMANFSEPDQFLKNLRAYWQHHQNVCYCISGSKRHMMTDIFNDRKQAFYRFGEIMFLNKISQNDWIRFIFSSFKKSGKKISKELAAKITSIMKLHSYYVQQLANHVWMLTEKEANENHLNRALKNLLDVNTILYQRDIENLSTTQINLLKALADGVKQFTSSTVMQQYKLGTPRNVIKNKKILENNDFIDISGKKLEFLDPAFEFWFKSYFMNKNIPYA